MSLEQVFLDRPVKGLDSVMAMAMVVVFILLQDLEEVA